MSQTVAEQWKELDEFVKQFEFQLERLNMTDEIAVNVSDHNVRFAWRNSDQPWGRIAKFRYNDVIAGLARIPTDLDEQHVTYEDKHGEWLVTISDEVSNVLAGSTTRIPSDIWDGR